MPGFANALADQACPGANSADRYRAGFMNPTMTIGCSSPRAFADIRAARNTYMIIMIEEKAVDMPA